MTAKKNGGKKDNGKKTVVPAPAAHKTDEVKTIPAVKQDETAAQDQVLTARHAPANNKRIKRTHDVISPLRHNHEHYAIGSTIDLDDDDGEATTLIKLGVLADPETN